MSLDFDPAVDHYKVLGVESKASIDDIKKAYRKLAKANHPDSTGGDKTKEQRFKQISNAYEVLGDPKKRAQYDAIRAGGGRMPGGMGGGFPGGASGGGVDLGDLFGQFFAGGRPGGRVRVERFDFGDEGGWPPHGGGGHGGGARRPGADAVDAEFESRVQASDGSWLTVTGADVHSDLRIPFDQAMLGTVAEVATLDGKAKVKIPPGSSSGRKLRLRGKGGVAGGRAGDHYVTVHLDVPAELDEEAKRLLVELVGRLKKPRR
ncbi:MAG: J domain-containing protein [Kofleriaceae bacterium]|jgi:molecular chaperone DnaJ|nr:J domain-containing protein [Kofleriaceae bacterium]MBP6837565.1 J domain-containing protein [Kofleriaceae bacterium]MBP9203108.1 J domain-containing protein [Kofleriaceae bacterium]